MEELSNEHDYIVTSLTCIVLYKIYTNEYIYIIVSNFISVNFALRPLCKGEGKEHNSTKE